MQIKHVKLRPFESQNYQTMKKIINLITVFSLLTFGMVSCDRNDDTTNNSTNPTDTTTPTDPISPSIEAFDRNGASNAVFSVSTERTVHFSKGNLQFQAHTGIWRFAENQFDVIGSGNTNISSTYDGWIDLFGWGTSGWSSGAICYEPWSTSSYYDYYYPGGNPINNLTNDYANSDWGVYNPISNGGNQPGMWRTLTKDEWGYLLFSRNSSTVNYINNARFAKASIGGVKGLILLPDIFSMPTGLNALVNINSSSTYSSYTDNSYTLEQWSQLESAGAIFLPNADYRIGNDMCSNGTDGSYWTSTYYDDYYSWHMGFGSVSVDVYHNDRCYGRSVRLVRD